MQGGIHILAMSHASGGGGSTFRRRGRRAIGMEGMPEEGQHRLEVKVRGRHRLKMKERTRILPKMEGRARI